MEITVRTESKFVTVPFSVVFNESVRPPALKLWCVLYGIAFTGQRCTMQRLCSELGTKHERSIRRWLHELESSGLISGWKRYGDLDEITVHTGRSSEVYTLNNIRDALAKGASLDEIKRIVESEIRTTESEIRTTESEIRTTESARTLESEPRTLESAKRTTESEIRTTESAERTLESEPRTLESALLDTDGSAKPQNGSPKSLKNQESKNHEESVHPQEEMPPDPAARWAAATETLQISMPRGDYESLLRGSELVQLADDQAVVACPDLATKTAMEDRYMRATRSALGVRIVMFVVKK